MALSVTRHGQKPGPQTWQFLLAGVDTLDLGFYVEWESVWPVLQPRLDRWKAAAAGSPGCLVEELPIGPVVVLAGGKPPMFRYHLQLPDAHIFIAAASTYRQSPNVYVSLAAELLWAVGPEAAATYLWGLLVDLGGRVDRLQVSRCDLCVDYFIPGGLSLEFLRSHRVSRSRHSRQHETGNRLETYYTGDAASPITARIYDKGLEILHSKKPWFLPLWKLADGTDVWRVEFQIRRAGLKAFAINDLESLRRRMAGLWVRLTADWLSFRLPDDSRSARRTVHPWWLEVEACGERFGAVMQVERMDASPSASAEWHEKHVLGCLSSYGAIQGVNDPDAALDLLGKAIKARMHRHEFRSMVSLKSIKLGKHPPVDPPAINGDPTPVGGDHV